MSKSKLIIILCIMCFGVGCATIPKTDNAIKIEAIENTGVFDDKPTDTPDMHNVKKNAREVVQLGKSGIENETARADQAVKKEQKEEYYANIGKKVIVCIVVLCMAAFGFVGLKIWKIKEKIIP